MNNHLTLVCGAGGFIGAHLVRRLKAMGRRVRGVDLKLPPFAPSAADEFVQGDLRDPDLAARVVAGSRVVYQLAADMGGAGFVFTGDHDAEIMHNSSQINLNVLEACRRAGVGQIFYSSSACVYPRHNQHDPAAPTTAEDSVCPADPDSDYGWEKLFSERLYFAYARNHGLRVRVARLHNVFGPEGSWNDGREKAPAALCRKVAAAPVGGSIEIWGDGEQTRSFLAIDECLEGVQRFMASDFCGPLNIGSAEMVSIDQLARMIMEIADKPLTIEHIPGPLGVRGRTSDNRLIRARLGWAPSRPLREGLAATYGWIATQVAAAGDAL
ncbi:NAD-dependent epimerase/dehydratase family protein [uncultured Thiodictyon sp.]|jgi:nucleoside-diphosphate-sugar epimerase|uniref:NAD-dependent epimerase/dehydratase family protein n=1 Tax=uncultured Thiodictyon sp. TaxID=1846217 RepID=UPI0025CDC92E|nr:NAD-dependent epimerase/dehydratase family protein [uncultured Thiodictyon sp.]